MPDTVYSTPVQSSVGLRPNLSAGQAPASAPITVPYSADPMTMPCSPGLSPQSDWIVCSAPEITTVSKPKRNPARADVRDQIRSRRLGRPAGAGEDGVKLPGRDETATLMADRRAWRDVRQDAYALAHDARRRDRGRGNQVRVRHRHGTR